MKHNGKTVWRSLLSLGAAVALLTLFLLPAVAASEEGDIHAIQVDAVFDHRGTVSITEVWDVDVPDDWTEMYTVKGHMGDMQIFDLTVKDLTTGASYETLDGWNVEWSRSEKTNKCGSFVDDDGQEELCWGVGSSGEHRYQVSYRMTNAMKAYSDGYDGFLIRFVNEGLSSTPETVTVTISGLDEEGNRIPFLHNDTRIWCFGMEGTIDLDDAGRIVAQSREDGRFRYCNVLARFDDGLFDPTSVSTKSFAEVRETAFDGSDYSDDDEGLGGETSTVRNKDRGIALVLGMLVLFGLIEFLSLFGRSRRDDRYLGLGPLQKKDLKTVDYSRVIPFDGDLPLSYTVLRSLEHHTNEGTILSAYLLRWFQQGRIRGEKQEAGKHNFNLFGDKAQYVLVFPEGGDEGLPPLEQKLWDIFTDAAGTDRTLQEKELYQWAKIHYPRITGFFNQVKTDGIATGRARGEVADLPKRILATTQLMPGLTEDGAEEAKKLLGFRKYLKDFTIINEREPRDVGLWGDYLVYAALFGMAEEVAKTFRELLPDYFVDPEAYGAADYRNGWDIYDTILLFNMLDHMTAAGTSGYHDGISEAARAAASSGEGGFSSLGGGGGFSGGGFGGGGR